MSAPDEMGLTPEAAQGYEQYFVPAIFAQWPPRIIEAARITKGDRVLEVGCGTGILAREVIKRVGSNGSVTGLDLSESMLGVARSICPDVEFQQGIVMDLPFAPPLLDEFYLGDEIERKLRRQDFAALGFNEDAI